MARSESQGEGEWGGRYEPRTIQSFAPNAPISLLHKQRNIELCWCKKVIHLLIVLDFVWVREPLNTRVFVFLCWSPWEL